MTAKYDHEQVAALRASGMDWDAIAERQGQDRERLRKAHDGWRARQGENYTPPRADAPDDGPSATALLTADDISRITSLEDLLTFFKVDTEIWEVRDFRVNKWEQAAKDKTTQEPIITPLYQVRANLIPNHERIREAARLATAQLLQDAQDHAPPYEPVERPELLAGDPVSWWLHIYDPHIGMLAWGDEVGADYDLKIATSDYARAAEHLLALARLYPVEEVNYVVGHDLAHVDGPASDGRGNRRGGATTGGTAQDLDTRLAKLFTAVRRVVIEAADRARLVAPVTLRVVPGNHDRDTMYKLGEVLHAWYRNDSEVTVVYGPQKRFFARYGQNGFMLTHGEEYSRKRDSLPLIFATEAPADLWAATTYREILTGHNHVKKGGRYVPTADADETRAIRTRSLPGLTPEDAWHYEQGYKHHRAATAIAYRRSGGLAGLHEFTL